MIRESLKSQYEVSKVACLEELQYYVKLNGDEMLSGRMHTTIGKLPQKEMDAMNETSRRLHFYEMEKKEKESLKKFRNLCKTDDKNTEFQLSDVSSVGTSSGSEDDNENTETDDAGVESWKTKDVVSFLVRLQPQKLYASGSGFKVMSGMIGTEIENGSEVNQNHRISRSRT